MTLAELDRRIDYIDGIGASRAFTVSSKHRCGGSPIRHPTVKRG